MPVHPFIEEQMKRNAKQKFDLLTTAAFLASRFGSTLQGALVSAHFAGGAPRAVHSSTNVHLTFQRSHTIPYHTFPFCSCGRSTVYNNPNPVVVGQIQRYIKQKFELLTPRAFFLIYILIRGRVWSISQEQQERGQAHPALHNPRKKRYAWIFDRWNNDDLYREPQPAIGWTTVKVKTWDILGSNDHTHTNAATNIKVQTQANLHLVKEHIRLDVLQSAKNYTIPNSTQQDTGWQPLIPLHLRVSPIRSSNKNRSSRGLVSNLPLPTQ